MLLKRPSRRDFLWATGVPFFGRRGGLSLAASGRSLATKGVAGPLESRDPFSGIVVQNGVPPARVKEAVLFPFDDYSIPFSWGLRLELLMGKKPGRANPIVLQRGEPGSPDSVRARYYGTVIQVGDELRMWYLGRGDREGPNEKLHVLYAVSKDGVVWEKPKLGLLDYGGNKQNNMVDILGGKYGFSEGPVIYDPDDPDPSRRFKMVFESDKYDNRIAAAFSPDGLRWTESPRNPLGPTLEESGLIKCNGCYYVNGQGGGHYGGGRKMVTFASYDFERWTQADALSFRRGPLTNVPLEHWNSVEEVHLGAALADRGNVILGIYGMWHGVPSGDRSRVTMDLGLIVSHDAVHYREPVHDFRFIPDWEEHQTPPGRAPTLAQGQGMVNLGDKTLYWYEEWGVGDVRLATWERDRFGYFSVFDRHGEPHLLSCPLKIEPEGAQIFINADGLSELTELTVELTDLEFRKLPGYSGKDCVPIRAPGLHQKVKWRNRPALEAFSHPVRVCVHFGGVRPEDAKLYAVYVARS